MVPNGTRQGRGEHLAVERIMALQVAQGQLPYPLLRPMPQPGNVATTRPVPESALQPTGNAVNVNGRQKKNAIANTQTQGLPTSVDQRGSTFSGMAPRHVFPLMDLPEEVKTRLDCTQDS